MYITVTESMFHDAFRDYNRLDNFSYQGRSALYDYLTSAESNEFEIELDVIALCCEYYEDSIKNVLKEYNLESIEDLENETQVIWHDNENVLYLAY
jgi:hypothetical protein